MMRVFENVGGPEDRLPLLPIKLRAGVERHQRNLADLVAKLGDAGMGADVIATTVRQLIISYEGELLAALGELARETADG